ncbi:MAG: flagellar hook-associated protein FlgK [Desulfovibrionaceae bacterium]
MFGANSILDMGRWALFASQAQLQVTGENISNVNTVGYSRRSVRLEESISIDYRPGQMGTGVRAAEVVRHFDEFVEKQYLDQATMRERWGTLNESLRTVETLFNESSGVGISDSISGFFNSWNDLSQRPDDYGTRRDLLEKSLTLTSTLHTANNNLAQMQQRIDELITNDVTNANTIIQKIAETNKNISIHENVGENAPNKLYDERASLVRDLAGIIDVYTIDKGGGDFTVLTKSGQNLVDGREHFSLEFGAPQTVKQLMAGSTFDGNAYFTGNDNYEYTIEVLSGGVVGSAATPGVASFRVSLDGGSTWLQDTDGSTKVFSARPYGHEVAANDLGIYFGANSNARVNPANALQVGDTFTIVPQKGLYWVENTSHKENITPVINFTGMDRTDRATGGSLAAYFNFRDAYVGRYRDKLDAMTETMIWETNRRHSQGAGLEKFSYVDGTYSVDDPNRALGSDSSGLFFGDRLQSGSSTVYIYDKDTGLLASSASLDFSDLPGQQNFDPTIHSLNDVAAAYNRTFGDHLTASVVNNRLRIEADSGKEFLFGTDTAGLNAALGVNTFFTGTNSSNIEVNQRITGDQDFLCSGHVNGAGEMNAGDNTTALSISNLKDLDVSIYTVQEGRTSQSLLEYYNAIVGGVGADVNTSKFNNKYHETMASDLNDRQQEVSGVNLDEEMANLIRYQHSYTAAAKLITTADQMLQTVLSMKS